MSFEITKAKQHGGFFSLKDLAKNGGPVLVLFRIVDFLAPEPAKGFDGTNVPVVADAIVASGTRRGEVHLSETFKGSITAQLRGVPNPRPAKGVGVIPAETKVGQYVLARVKVINEGKGNESAAGDEPSDVELASVSEWFNEGMWEVDLVGASAPAGGGASAAAAAASDKPWLRQ